ncbi:MAG TPA: SycD/LcrH family type III secretion system chaperone [Burkholderiaceae bacterium]|nr:SycD/LcrH family type III secretion system chaperone [Burkholderiaceae bacterium]
MQSATTPQNTAADVHPGDLLREQLDALPSSSRLSSEQLEVVYALAYSHVAQHQYEQAMPIFSFLCLYGPTRKHYLVGLALCLQMCQRYEEAIDIYALVLTLYPDHYDAALRIAECQLANEQLDAALITLDLLYEVGQAAPEQAPWLAKVMALQKLLQGSTA